MALPVYIRGETSPVVIVVATAKEVEVGDIVGVASDTLVKASDETWDTNLATTQTNFAAKFIGASGQRKDANVARVTGNAADNRIRVSSEGVWEYDCASATFFVGDFVGPADSGSNSLLDDKVVEVATEALSIGVVAETVATAATRVKVRLHSQKYPSARQS